MCLALTIVYACVRCQGTVMKDAYQVPGTACAEAAAKGPGFFGACGRGVERRTQRQRCPDNDEVDAGKPAAAAHRGRLLRRDERLCAGCELDDEVRDLDADSEVLDAPAAGAASASSARTGEAHADDFTILPFWVERASRRGRAAARTDAGPDALDTALTLRGGSGSGYDADGDKDSEPDSDSDSDEDDDDDDDDDDDGGTSLNQDDDDDDDDDGDDGAKV